MPNNPLAEICGFPITNSTSTAVSHREGLLCPFHNVCPNCTKDKADNPLAVCSVNYNGHAVITCPVRYREDWIILKNAVKFVWPDGGRWTTLPEVKLKDADGSQAGNIDYVLVKYNDKGKIVDFASIEVQGVYISGNLRNPFESYMDHPTSRFNWDGGKNPHPDFLSSSRKRLLPQLLYKGGIFKAWNKKQCVVIQKAFYDTLPELPQTSKEKADIAWFLYDLEYNRREKRYHLVLVDTVYTDFEAALNKVIFTKPGNVVDFVKILQDKLDEKMSNVPETHSVFELL